MPDNPLTDNERRLVAAYTSLMGERDRLKKSLEAARDALSYIVWMSERNDPRWTYRRAALAAETALAHMAKLEIP